MVSMPDAPRAAGPGCSGSTPPPGRGWRGPGRARAAAPCRRPRARPRSPSSRSAGGPPRGAASLRASRVSFSSLESSRKSSIIWSSTTLLGVLQPGDQQGELGAAGLGAALVQLGEVGAGPALVAHPQVHQALLVVGVVADARRGRKPRSSEPKICSSIITSSCGTSVRTLQRLQRLGERPGGCCARGRPCARYTAPGVAEVRGR